MVRKVTDLPYVVDRTTRRKGKTYVYFYFERAGERYRLPDPSKDEDAFLEAYNDVRKGRRPVRPILGHYTYRKLILHYRQNSVTKQGARKRKGYMDLAPRTRKDYDQVLEYLDREVGNLDFRKTIRVDVQEAMDANDHRKKFANNLKQVWSILHEHAIDKGWRTTNAAAGIQKFKTGEGHIPWPVDVQARFWNAAGDFSFGYHVRLAMILYIDSAQRGGDILDYRWSDVDQEGITLSQNKTNTLVFVPFTDWMRDALDVERERQVSAKIVPMPPNDFILQGPRGGKLSYNTLNDRFVKVRKHAGIEGRYTLHGFRYTAASELGAAVGRIGASVTGHLSPEMFDKYAGDAMRRSQAITAQSERNKNRPKRESLKTTLKK